MRRVDGEQSSYRVAVLRAEQGELHRCKTLQSLEQDARGVAVPERAREVWVFWSAAPYLATGGGQRPAQLARAAATDPERAVFHCSMGDPGGLYLRHGVYYGQPGYVLPAALRVQAERRVAVFHIAHEHSLRVFLQLEGSGWRRVYDHLDDWQGFRELWGAAAAWWDRRIEQRFMRESDAVTATSRWLADYCREEHGVEARLVPNATALRPRDAERPWDLPPSRPLALFVGYMGMWVDRRWMERLAQRLRAAGGRLVIIATGQVHTVPGAAVLGERRVEELHGYLRHVDCGIIPFRPSRVSAAVDPIKWYDYRAYGLPVAVRGLPELQGREATYEFEDGMEAALWLLRGGAARRPPDDEWLRANSWQARFEELSDAAG